MMMASESHNEEQQTTQEVKSILKKLKEMFGEAIAKAFEDEDITEPEALGDLLERDSDASIFKQLGLNFGKVVKLKKEFKSLRRSSGRESNKALKYKPTMAALGSCDAEIRSMYLTKRKKVGLLAAQKWGGDFYPKFNNPQAKIELEQFANEIAEQCAVPEVGFDVQGIIQHVRDYFNEQRRHRKRSGGCCNSSSSSESSPDVKAEKVNLSSKKKMMPDPPLTKKLAKKPRLPSMADASGNSCETDGDSSDDTQANDDTDDTIILNNPQDLELENSGQGDSGNFQLQPDVNIPNKTCNLILKSVCGLKVVKERESVVKVLKNEFGVSQHTITDLTHSQLVEILAKKLIKHKFITFRKDIVNLEKLTSSDFSVRKSLY